MKSELLMRIKDAEAAADARVAEARDEAQKTVAEARREAERIVADGKAAADASYQARLDEARTAAQADAEQVLAEGDKQAKALRKRFAAGMDGVGGRVQKLFEGRL